MTLAARNHVLGEAKAKEEVTVIIRADREARVQHIIKTMTAIKQAGFRKLQFRLRCCGHDLPNKPEAAAVQRRRAKLLQGATVVGRRIATIPLPAIAGIAPRMLRHHSVASHFRDDRGGRDRPTPGIAIYVLIVV